jgi:hypothetical protein
MRKIASESALAHVDDCVNAHCEHDPLIWSDDHPEPAWLWCALCKAEAVISGVHHEGDVSLDAEAANA